MSSLLQSIGSSPYVHVHIVGPLAATAATFCFNTLLMNIESTTLLIFCILKFLRKVVLKKLFQMFISMLALLLTPYNALCCMNVSSSLVILSKML